MAWADTDDDLFAIDDDEFVGDADVPTPTPTPLPIPVAVAVPAVRSQRRMRLACAVLLLATLPAVAFAGGVLTNPRQTPKSTKTTTGRSHPSTAAGDVEVCVRLASGARLRGRATPGRSAGELRLVGIEQTWLLPRGEIVEITPVTSLR